MVFSLSFVNGIVHVDPCHLSQFRLRQCVLSLGCELVTLGKGKSLSICITKW